MTTNVGQNSAILTSCMAKGAFLKSELAGQTMVALVILSYFENEIAFLMKNNFLRV